MIWPFKRKRQVPVLPDEIIARFIETNYMMTVRGMSIFTVNGEVYTYLGGPDRTLIDHRGSMFHLSATSAMFLAAHLNRMPVHQVQ